MFRDAGSPWSRSITNGASTFLVALAAVSLFALASPASARPDQIPLVPNPALSTEEPNDPISVMIVGDSITQGQEGDWTWRYRIWQWFKDEGIEVCSVSTLLFHIVANGNIFRLILSGHGGVPGHLRRRTL